MALTVCLLQQDAHFVWQGKAISPNSKKATALLCYLAAQPKAVSREQLAELLWQVGKLNSVRQALYELRQLEGAESWLKDETENVQVICTPDTALFEKDLETKDYATAIKRYKNDFLENLKLNKVPAFTDWLELERLRFKEKLHDARTAFVAELEQKGQYEEALSLALDLLEHDPLNETAHRVIMRLHHKKGDQEAALEQFETLRLKLRDELDVEPLPETLALLAEIEGGSASARRAYFLENVEQIPNRAEAFLGRADLKDHILKQLNESSVLIHGFGGMGKSALAAEIAASYLEKVKHRAILWLEVGTDSFENTLDALVSPFKMNQQLAQAKDQKTFLTGLLSEHKVSLIIRDDIRNAYTLSQLSEGLPQNISLLLSSRSRYPKLKRVYLDKLERTESLELLSHHAKLELQDNPEADKLADYLGDHAYALRLAGITLAKQANHNPQKLLEQIRTNPFALKLPPELADKGKESIANLLDVSLNPLNDAEYEAFLSYGALSTASASPELIAKLNRRDPEETENALYTLSTRGLAQRHVEQDSDQIIYRLHDLAHAFAKSNCPIRLKTLRRATLEYLEAHKDTVNAVDVELSNILGAAESSSSDDLIEFMMLLTVKGSYFTARGHTNRSIALLKEAIGVSKKHDNAAATHSLLGKLGDIYHYHSGELAEAERVYQEALEVSRQEGNKAREAVFLSLLSLVSFHQKGSSLSHYNSEALSLSAFADPENRCTVLLQQAYLAAQTEQFEDAALMFRQTLDIVDEMMKTESTRTPEIMRRKFFALLNLGGTEHALKHFDSALEIHKEALTLAETQDNQLWLAHASLEIGETQLSLGDLSEAQAQLQKARGIYQENNASEYVKRVDKLLEASPQS